MNEKVAPKVTTTMLVTLGKPLLHRQEPILKTWITGISWTAKNSYKHG